MIRNRPPELSIPKLAEKAGVNESFIKSLIYGGVKDAAVGRIEALYNALADRPLFSEQDK